MRKQHGVTHPRNLYRVTFSCADGSEPQFTVWAESPEHAIRKADAKYKGSVLVVNKAAEEIKS